jgi:hypothetical protein
VRAAVPLIDVLDPDAIAIGFRVDVVHVVRDMRIPDELGDVAFSIDNVVRAGRPRAEGIDGGTLVLR